MRISKIITVIYVVLIPFAGLYASAAEVNVFTYIEKLIQNREFEKARFEIDSILNSKKNLTSGDSSYLFMHLGISLHHLAKHYEAIDALEAAVVLADESSDQDLKFLTRFNLGKVYRYGLVDAQRSLEFFNSAAIHLDTMNVRHSALLDYELGMHAFIIGEIENCGLFAQSALSKIRTLPESHVYAVLSGIQKLFGIYYFMSGNNDQSKEAILEAIRLHQKYEGREAFELGRLYNNFGVIYQFEQDLETAARYYHKGLKINSRYNYNWDRISNSYLNLGENMEARGIADSALYFYRACLENREKFYPPNNPEVFALYFHLGNFYEGENQLDWALHYNQLALSSVLPGYRPLDENDLPRRVPIAFNMTFISSILSRASIFHSRYKLYPDSVALFEQALNAYIRMDSLIQLTRSTTTFDKTRISYSETFHDHYERAIRCAYEGYQKFGNDNYFVHGLRFSERNKANLLLDDIRNSISTDIPDHIRKRNDDLRYQYSEVERQLANLKAYENREYDSLTQVLFRLSREQLALHGSLRQGVSVDDNLVRKEHIFDFQKMGITMIEYFWGDSALYAFSIRPDSLVMERNPDISELQSKTEEFYELLNLDRFSKIKNPQNFRKFTKLGYQLYSILINGKADDLGNAVLIIPDGDLNKLPFEAMISNEYPGDNVNYKDLDYLIKRKTVGYSYSLSYFLNSGSRIRGDKNVLVISDKSLPGSVDESNSIDQLMKNVLRREGLGKNEFLKESSKYDIIHLGLHGFLNEENYLDGYLQLSSDVNDKLFVHDLFGLDLNASLAVLSACESGVGKFNRGEGVYSFARGFSGAGVDNVIFSLWRIGDQSTSRIITSFYEHYKENKDSSEALSLAKLNYLDQADYITAYPGLWAGLVGVTSTQSKTRDQKRLLVSIFIALILLFILFRKIHQYRLKNS